MSHMYFPYSKLVDICNNIKSNLSKHTYFSGWQVCGDEPAVVNNSSSVSISEIYY